MSAEHMIKKLRQKMEKDLGHKPTERENEILNVALGVISEKMAIMGTPKFVYNLMHHKKQFEKQIEYETIERCKQEGFTDEEIKIITEMK